MSLYHRRLISDLVCVYKLFHKQHGAVLTHNNFFVINTNRNKTRGHNYKLQMPYAKLDCRKYCFAHRVIDFWNNLPYIIVNCKSENKFRNSVIPVPFVKGMNDEGIN